MKKQYAFPGLESKERKPKKPDPVDKWVDGAAPAASTAAPDGPFVEMKRFTIDVPEPLHRRFKSECAMHGLKMADVIRDLLEVKLGHLQAQSRESSKS